MLKTSTDTPRHALNGPTMGTRWTAVFHADAAPGPSALHSALQAAVDDVDAQMSTWKPDSALMRLNAAPVGAWVALPERLAVVLDLGLRIGRASGGAFDIAMGSAVRAWGFGADDANPDAIKAAMQAGYRPAHEALELDLPACRARKHHAVTLDLNGIAKGYGVDRLAETLVQHGIGAGLVGIDGEMRGMGLRPDGTPWTVAVEAPDPDRRAPHSILALHDAAVATSGDYRHWVTVQGRRLSHTMDPRRGAPLLVPPASVTVATRTCAEADAWATALMVLGVEKGADLAKAQGLNALFLTRGTAGTFQSTAVGPLFQPGAENAGALPHPTLA